MRVPPVVLSIAGHDPSSGAGITADIKTAASLGCYAATSVTALTVQSTQGVFGVQQLEPSFVLRTLTALTEDFQMAAVRLGMLGSGGVAKVVAGFLQSAKLPNIVLDPVIGSSSGALLLDAEGLQVIRDSLIPLADVITPNVDEAAVLARSEPIDVEGSWEAALPQIRRLAAELHTLGAKAVIITGGHLQSPHDYLSYTESGLTREEILRGQRLDSRSTHGTGCAFATALACHLALGLRLPYAVRAAKDYVRRTITAAFSLGKGTGPLNHFP